MADVRAKELRHEVVFVKRDGSTMSIRLSDNTTRSICTAGRTLDARYFVAIEEWSMIENAPIWGVFDMDRAQKDNPVPGEWSTDDPIKKFPPGCLDAAVVYAVAMLGRR